MSNSSKKKDSTTASTVSEIKPAGEKKVEPVKNTISLDKDKPAKTQQAAGGCCAKG